LVDAAKMSKNQNNEIEKCVLTKVGHAALSDLLATMRMISTAYQERQKMYFVHPPPVRVGTGSLVQEREAILSRGSVGCTVHAQHPVNSAERRFKLQVYSMW
jgi:hypothetical protein